MGSTYRSLERFKKKFFSNLTVLDMAEKKEEDFDTELEAQAGCDERNDPPDYKTCGECGFDHERSAHLNFEIDDLLYPQPELPFTD